MDSTGAIRGALSVREVLAGGVGGTIEGTIEVDSNRGSLISV